MAIWRGDQLRLRCSATHARSLGRLLSRQACARRALRQALASASPARYEHLPPLRRTSRLTVEAALPRSRAMSRIDRPADSPLEISSRSAARSACGARRRVRGANPPSRLKTLRTLTGLRFRCSATCESVNPSFQARHSATRSSVPNSLRTMQHLPKRIEPKVLQRRVYVTQDPFSGRLSCRACPSKAGRAPRSPAFSPSPPG